MCDSTASRANRWVWSSAPPQPASRSMAQQQKKSARATRTKVNRAGIARSARPLRLPQLADPRLLADAAAEVVELRPVDVADHRDLELLDLGRVEGERPLDADAERVLAHREGLPDPGALALDADPLEDLDALAIALDDLEVDAHRVAGLEVRDVTQLAPLEAVDDRAHEKGRPTGRGRMIAKAAAL